MFKVTVVSIQSSHTSPSKCKCSSPSRNLTSCSLLTPLLYSYNCLSCGNVIYGISCLCSLGCLSYGNVICGTIVIYLITWIVGGTALTIVDTTDGFTLPLIIFCALQFVLPRSFFISKTKSPPSSTLFFLSKALLGEFVATFFPFFSVIYISSLVLLTLSDGFCGLSF